MWRRAAVRGFLARAATRNALTLRRQSAKQVPAVCALLGVGVAAVATAAISSKDREDGCVQLERAASGEKRHMALSRNFIADAVEKALPAVVNVAVNSGYFSSNGSGFLIASNGLVVTNAHVIARCNRYSKIQVTFADGSKYPAVIHSTDPLSDIAILQIESEDRKEWPTIALGASSDLRAGEWVCALGSPFSLQNSVSAGIISAVARHSSELGYPQKSGEYIQTDAAINSGNSGGPLVNLDGEVIGINTMKVDGSVGISFAIPIDTAAQVIDQLLTHKKVVRAYIGLQMVNARDLKQSSRSDLKEGVVVKSVALGSPAHKGGLLPNDIIVSFDSKPVRSTKDISSAVGYTIGRRIEVQVLRAGEKAPRTLQLTTEPLPVALGP